MGRLRHKECDRCHIDSQVLYRVKIDASQRWYFICQPCWQSVQENNPHYVYGGTWKARKP